ncbi:MAG: membrane protein insertase YidC, partial [Flavobacteriales bacterium]|nr:membrane protein insertase YidC [Flavobacteriales bacterium]
ILYAMFRFFPASIELRQESFLWAEDLSSYDSIYSLPWEIPFYGDHISLFTLLMAISTFFYSKYNMDMSGGANAQMPQMKMMIYFMPFMLLFFFNSYSSGLSYYYFMANVITMIQQFVIKRYFINDDAIRAKIQANKTKTKTKSKFQKRLEKMAKNRGYQPPKK